MARSDAGVLAAAGRSASSGRSWCFPDGGLQHVGVTLPGGKPGHPFYGYPGQAPGLLLPATCCRTTAPPSPGRA